jgi:uncharacterized membrane protein
MGKERSRLLQAWHGLERFRKVETVMLLIFIIWLLLVVSVPFSLPHGSVRDLAGTTGIIDNGDLIERMNPLAQAIYLLGDLNCHQLSERSLYLNDNQMPFCSRDLGIFAGLVLGLAVAMTFRWRIRLFWFVISLIPIALDGFAQTLTGYESENSIRILTGILAGTGVGLMLSRLAQDKLSDSRIKKEVNNETEG